MPISPPAEQLLDLPMMDLMGLFGRMRSLTDNAGFRGTLPAIWQCSDESQSIKKALFGYVYNCPAFNLGRVGALLDPTRLATAAHHGNDLVILGGSHLGAEEVDGIGHIRRVHGEVASCCGMLQRLLGEYLPVYRRATQLIKVFRDADDVKVEVPYKYLFQKPAGETVRMQIRMHKLVEGDALGEGTLGKIYRLHPELASGWPRDLAGLDDVPQPIGRLLDAEMFGFVKTLESGSHEPQKMLETSIFDFLPGIVASSHPHRRLCDVNTWRQFHRIASYLTDSFDAGTRNVFVLAGLTIDHTIRKNSFIPQFGFWMERGQALQARYFGPDDIQGLMAEQEVYRPPVTFLEYAGL